MSSERRFNALVKNSLKFNGSCLERHVNNCERERLRPDEDDGEEKKKEEGKGSNNENQIGVCGATGGLVCFLTVADFGIGMNKN